MMNQSSRRYQKKTSKGHWHEFLIVRFFILDPGTPLSLSLYVRQSEQFFFRIIKCLLLFHFIGVLEKKVAMLCFLRFKK